MKKVVIIGISVVLIFGFFHFSVIALNNMGTNHVPFEMGNYIGIYRNAHDGDSPLTSSAYTGVYQLTPDEGEVTYNWSAYAYIWNGEEGEAYSGTYNLYAEVMTFNLSVENADFVGVFADSTGFYVEMSPPPGNVDLDIDDCESFAEISGEDQINGNARSSRAEIPF